MNESEHLLPLVSLNPRKRVLTHPVMVRGRPFDPTSPQDAHFEVIPSNTPGIMFDVGGVRIPYAPQYIEARDSGLWRMLVLKHPDYDFQIFLLEHLGGALRAMGLEDGVTIKIGESCRGRLTSSNAPFFWFKRKTYWIPVTWPGIQGFVQQLLPHCSEVPGPQKIISVTGRHMHEIFDPKYNIHRRMTIEQCSEFRVRVESALQTDMPNCPESTPIEVWENDLSSFLHARAMMRLSSTHKNPAMRLVISLALQSLLWWFNLRSSGMTHQTYVRARYLHTAQDIINLMWSEFREWANEHLYHNVLDLLGEIIAFLQGAHFHGKITLENTNHVFRMEALRALLIPEILWE